MSEEVVEQKKKVKKPKSKLRKTIEWILTGLFLVLFGIVMAGQIDGLVHRKEHYGQQIRFGYATFVVKTDSMEPEYKVDSAIVTYLQDVNTIIERFNKGENVDVTFMDVYTGPATPDTPEFTSRTTITNYPMTHRLREVHKTETGYVFIASGINIGAHLSAANQYQAFTEAELLGVVVANSNFLGVFFGFIGSPLGLLALLLIPAMYLVITSVIDIFKAYKEPDEQPAAEGQVVDTGTIDLSEEDKKRLKAELLDEMMNKKKKGD